MKLVGILCTSLETSYIHDFFRRPCTCMYSHLVKNGKDPASCVLGFLVYGRTNSLKALRICSHFIFPNPLIGRARRAKLFRGVRTGVRGGVAAHSSREPIEVSKHQSIQFETSLNLEHLKLIMIWHVEFCQMSWGLLGAFFFLGVLFTFAFGEAITFAFAFAFALALGLPSAPFDSFGSSSSSCASSPSPSDSSL